MSKMFRMFFEKLPEMKDFNVSCKLNISDNFGIRTKDRDRFYHYYHNNNGDEYSTIKVRCNMKLRQVDRLRKSARGSFPRKTRNDSALDWRKR